MADQEQVMRETQDKNTVAEPLIVIGWNDAGELCVNLKGVDPGNAVQMLEQMMNTMKGACLYRKPRQVIPIRGKLVDTNGDRRH